MRLLLINPPSPVHLGSPLLGQQYRVAALRAHGCDVRVIDASAQRLRPSHDEILRIIDHWQPDVTSMAVFTRWVYHAYELARALRGRSRWLVAGGAHPTSRPMEPLGHGFDAVLGGEAEQSIVRFAECIAGRGDLASIPGTVFRDSDGRVHMGPPARFIDDLDSLPTPLHAQDLCDSSWYSATAPPSSRSGTTPSPRTCVVCSKCCRRSRPTCRSPRRGSPSRGPSTPGRMSFAR
jgi:radical SAM superfamily enzyme YgiQ (UPF0313 family)